MKPIADRIAEIAGFIIVIGGLGYWGYSSWVAEPAAEKKNSMETRSRSAQRFKDWAYVAKEKEISPNETVKLIIIPSPYGIPVMDTKCLIYTNQEFKTSSMICPNAEQNNIEEK